jgi:hypothetical protein
MASVKVTRADWPPELELKPMQSSRRLAYSRRLTPRATEVLVRGVRPLESDHWFIFEEDDVVHLYRTPWDIHWFAIRLHRLADGGAEIAEVAYNEEYADDPRPAWKRTRMAETGRSTKRLDRGARWILNHFFDSFSETRAAAVRRLLRDPLSLKRHMWGIYG